MTSTRSIGVVILVCAYLIASIVISALIARRNTDRSQYLLAGKSLGVIAVGLVLMSEFLGMGSTVGSAEFAYKHGIGAAWQLVSIALAFIVLAFWLAPRYRAHPEPTVSGIIYREYGTASRYLTSAMMLYALLSVSTAIYLGGTSTLVPILGLPRWIILLVLAAVTLAYLVLGGMRGVALTNALDALLIILGTGVAAVVGLHQVGGLGVLHSKVHPFMFQPTSIGWGIIVAWFLSNLGAIFATQYIVQSLASAKNPATARRASLLAAGAVLPIAFFTTMAGMSASQLFPGQDPSQAFGLIAAHTNPLLGGLIVVGVGAAMLGTLGAITHSCTQLVDSDFIPPIRRRLGRQGRENGVWQARFVNMFFVLLPVPFVLFVPSILDLVFFARGIRASIAVVIVYVLVGAKRIHPAPVFIALLVSVLGATGWFFAGNPLGINELYVSIIVPILGLLTGWILNHRTPPKYPEQNRLDKAGA